MAKTAEERSIALPLEVGMAKPETPYDAALRRVAEQEVRVGRQKWVIARLEANGAASGGAKRQLAKLEDLLAALRISLSRYRYRRQ